LIQDNPLQTISEYKSQNRIKNLNLESKEKKRERLDRNNANKKKRQEKLSFDEQLTNQLIRTEKAQNVKLGKSNEQLNIDKERARELKIRRLQDNVNDQKADYKDLQSKLKDKKLEGTPLLKTNEAALLQFHNRILFKKGEKKSEFPPRLINNDAIYEKTRIKIEKLPEVDTYVCLSCSLVLPAITHPDLFMLQKKFQDIPNLHVLKIKRMTPHQNTSINTIQYHGQNQFDNFLIDPKAICNENQLISICTKCFASLESNNLPKYSLANGLYFGPTHSDLPKLTFLEKKCISMVRFNSFLVKLHMTHGTRQLAFKGHLITKPQDPLPLIRLSLPPFVSELCESIQIVLTKPSLSPYESMKKMLSDILSCNKSSIRVWLTFLIKNHSAYSKITINNESLKTFGVDKVYQHLMKTAEIINDDDNSEVGHNIDVNEYKEPIKSLEFFQKSLILDETGSSLPSTEIYDHCESQINVDKNVISMMSGSKPINLNDDHLLAKAFPHLYYYGIGSRHKERRIQISLEDEILHLLSIDDSRFRKDSAFSCTFYEMIVKKQIFSSIQYTVKSIDDKSLEAIHEYAMKSPSREPDTESKNNLSTKILSQCKLSSKMAPFSQTYKSRNRRQLLALIVEYGPPSIFVTFTPNDVINPTAYSFCLNDPKEFNLKDLQDNEFRTANASSNPIGLAKFFATMTSTIIENLFGSKNVHNIGIFGKLQSYFGMVETQNRGTLHIHMLLWLHGLVI